MAQGTTIGGKSCGIGSKVAFNMPVAGTITAVEPGAGANGKDLVTFKPDAPPYPGAPAEVILQTDAGLLTWPLPGAA